MRYETQESGSTTEDMGTKGGGGLTHSGGAARRRPGDPCASQKTAQLCHQRRRGSGSSVHTPLLFQHKGNACWFLVSLCCLLRPKQLSALGNWFETSSIEGACLHVWVEDSVDLAEQGAFALCAGRGLLAQLGFLAVQELLMPLIDLLLATHQVVLPQDDIALVILHQQPADIAPPRRSETQTQSCAVE